jgi:hypothetical protein
MRAKWCKWGERFCEADELPENLSMFKVFYSWMSDQGEAQRGFVRMALKQAIEKVQTDSTPTGEESEGESQRLEKDQTQLCSTGQKRERPIVECGRFGEPTDIFRFILSRIPECHAYVVDLTFINKKGEEETRRSPNPNNMLEFGIAIQSLGENHCIPVFNTDHGAPSQLPFDIRNFNVIEFDTAAGWKALGANIARQLESCFRDYLDQKNCFRSQLGESLVMPIAFLGKFVREHYTGNLEDASILLLSQDPKNALVGPYRPIDNFFFACGLGSLSERVANRSFTWAEAISVLLIRLQADCERICYRYPRLASTRIYQQAEDMGKQAKHLKEIIGPMDKFQEPDFYGIFNRETAMFLNNLCKLYLAVRDKKKDGSDLVEST